MFLKLTHIIASVDCRFYFCEGLQELPADDCPGCQIGGHMTLLRSYPYSALIVLTTATILLLPSQACADFRIRGSLGAKTYGYEDPDGDGHLWLIQSTRVSVLQADGPFSLHFSGGYLGDNADEFSNSGEARFYKGYLQYGRSYSSISTRGGRFFLHKGVAVGVLDGVDITGSITGNLNLSVFAGMMSPLSRRFEFEDPAENFAAGGQLRWSPNFKKGLPYLGRSVFTVSFIQQNRNDLLLRRHLGLASYHRINRDLTWLNNIHLKMSGNALRKAITRIRYRTSTWNGLVEAGLLTPYVADYSWFNTFKVPPQARIRLAANRYLVENSWGGGIEGTVLLTSGTSGLRAGPVLTTPIGQIGYRTSSGDMPRSDGPWLNLRYSPTDRLDVYAFGSKTSYEWEAMSIDADDLTIIHAGARYTPEFLPSATFFAEFQEYRTPRIDQDRRALGGLTWRFDTGEKRR